MTRLQGKVTKGWGSEQIWVTNEYYCSKFLNFNKGAKSSMHFHTKKVESWLIQSGVFKVTFIDMIDASTEVETYSKGDIITIKVMKPHQVECLEAGTILEVSTPDSVEDNYRVIKGDSQK